MNQDDPKNIFYLKNEESTIASKKTNWKNGGAGTVSDDDFDQLIVHMESSRIEVKKEQESEEEEFF